jgi:D-psicose/D-tagatose/L-ribulose 3-epimerase
VKGKPLRSKVGLSVSNIAFPAGKLEDALALLSRLDVDTLEVAPYNVFGRWDASDADIEAFRLRLTDAGMRCIALQGITFNAGEAHLFASADRREALYRHLVVVAQMAGRLGAGACVFGAPRLRDPGDLEPEQARAIAVDFLRRMGSVFSSEGTTLSFEANARHYACRFITTTTEAIDLMKEVDVSGVGLQIDTGTLFLEQEEPDVLIQAAPYAAHAHVSEPDLLPVGSTDVDHHSVAAALRESGYAGSLSIEMKETSDWPSALQRAVAFTRETYWR